MTSNIHSDGASAPTAEPNYSETTTVSPVVATNPAAQPAGVPSPAPQPSETDADHNHSQPPLHRDPPAVTVVDVSYIETMRRKGIPVSLIITVVRRCAQLKGVISEAIGQCISCIEAFLAANGYLLNSSVQRDFVARAFDHSVTGNLTVVVPGEMKAGRSGQAFIGEFARAARAIDEADFSATVVRKVAAMRGI